MTETVVLEWLADYGALSPVEVHSFASSLEHNQELVTALYNVLEERNRYQDLIDPVCTQLFGFYRSREVELQRFTLQFLPTLIFVYLNSVAHGDKKSCRAVETLLIGLYNLEAVDENGQPKVVSFRLPSLAQDSIYHEPMSLAPASLTESALRRLEECNTKLVSWGPLPQVEVLNAQNRLKVMTALLFVYNHQLGLMPKSAMEPLCKVSSKLVTQGFNKPGHHQRSSYGSDSSFVPRLLPRIPVSSQFLLEFVNAIYFAMFNGYSYIATQALEDIYHRACYECYSEVILVANAIRNSLTVNPSGQPCDGPMGISVALSPATTTVTTVSKSMITNASFRTKKLPDDIEEEIVPNLSTSQPELEARQRPSPCGGHDGETASDTASESGAPGKEKAGKGGAKWRGWSWKHNSSNRTSLEEEGDDIPIQNPNDEAGGEGKNLASISEEQEELEKLTPRGSSLRAKDSVKKLPNFPGLGKKVKDTKGTNKNGVAPLEKKDSLNEGKKSLLANTKDGSKNPSNRGSILSVVLNGGDSSTSDVDGPLRKKSSSAMESANGPVSLEGTMTNGSISSVATTGDLEKGADSLATTSDALETQSLFTADSMDLSVSEDGDKLGETPLSHCKQMDLQNHSSMQISTV